MSNENLDIQQALADIALLRRVLNKTEQDQIDSRLVGITLDANLFLQASALLFALGFLIMEISSAGSLTGALMAANASIELRNSGLMLIALMLTGLLVLFYFIVWRAARHNGEEINAYIGRNFRYMRNLSLVSDLLMKYITLALIVLAGKPEWFGPLLVAFTGDYLLQQRLFTLPTRTSVIAGMACILVAFALFITETNNLGIPLAIFSLINAISVARLLMRYKSLKNAEQQLE